METNIEEIWKDVVGYEGYYQVSNLGRVRSLQFRKVIMSQSTDKRKYKVLTLQVGSVKKNVFVARLVAMAFIPNPLNHAFVNHKDEIPSNNHVDNLEWCTPRYNTNYGSRNLKVSKALTNRADISKRVIQLSLDGKFIKEWPSLGEIERVLGYTHGNIGMCCRGKSIQSHGFKWEYKS